jgi:hypothetical protein
MWHILTLVAFNMWVETKIGQHTICLPSPYEAHKVGSMYLAVPQIYLAIYACNPYACNPCAGVMLI